jgi:hypothetical protein
LLEHLSFRASLAEYEKQAGELWAGHQAAEPWALGIIHQKHPRFLDQEVRWLPLPISDAEIARAHFDAGDARLALARWYDFLDWAALTAYVEGVARDDSFEAAVEAVVGGDVAGLADLLRAHADLIHARSERVAPFDPPRHRATLLHYVAANGVEGYRQKTPPNAVDIAEALLSAGADVDALADMYGGQCTTMSLLVSSCHPARAGVQVALVDKLADHGASVGPSPLKTALVFGYLDAAEALVRRGAPVDDVAAAAGLGRVEDVKRLLPDSTPEQRHSAFALSAQLGHTGVVRLLLEAGEDPDRYNPPSHHAHSTPLHQAALAGHLAVVRLLVERGARLDNRDKLWQGTPLGWAEHGAKKEVADYLRGCGDSGAH